MTQPADPVMVAPYMWAIDPAIVPGWDTATAAQQESAGQLAVYVVWALSGRRYGVRDVTLRPQSASWQVWDCVGGPGYALPGPVQAVTQVVVDGVVLDPAGYRLESDVLYRTDSLVWPASQDMSQPATAPGTWQITYQRGTRVPLAAERAAAAMVAELLAGLSPTTTPPPAGGGGVSQPGLGLGRRIPPRARSISREGVAIDLVDPTEFTDKGLTGVPEVDAFLQAANPHRLTTPPQVWSPDIDEQGITAPPAAGDWW